MNKNSNGIGIEDEGEYEYEDEEGEIEAEVEGEEGGEEEEEEAPKLKYHRLTSSVNDIIVRETATCLTSHDKFMALGTSSGKVYILDFAGDLIQSYEAHNHPIMDISIEISGEFVASCCNEGKVIIKSLYSKEIIEHSYKRPVLSVAIDPEFSRRDTRQFVCGGKAGQLVLNTKGFFGFSSKNQILHSGEGTIFAIKWRGSLIAWANEAGVKIYDCYLNQRITFIERLPGSPRPDLHRCSLFWQNDTTLLIGWANTVQICKVSEKLTAITGITQRYVEVSSRFTTSSIIAGIAPFNDSEIVSVAFTPAESAETKDALELKMISCAGDELSIDTLEVNSRDAQTSNSYILECVNSLEPLYFILAPHDIIVAKLCDKDDYVNWLVSKLKFKEALEQATIYEQQLYTISKIDVGQKYLDDLLKSKNTKEAAKLCSQILRTSKQWEEWIYKFITVRKLMDLAPFIPYKEPILSPMVYEAALKCLLDMDTPLFVEIVKKWPSNLYNIQAVIVAILDLLKNSQDQILMDALVELYSLDKQYNKALFINLKMKTVKSFELIRQHNLFNEIQDQIALLFAANPEEAINLLVNNIDTVGIHQVVKQMEQNGPKQLADKKSEIYLHQYLDALFSKDPKLTRDFHQKQLEFYCKYEPEKLSFFLNKSDDYDLAKAIALCEKHERYNESVFLYVKTGKPERALEILIDNVKDLKQAIEFAQIQNDEALWAKLVDQCIKIPDFIGGLLDSIGSNVDPIKIIKRIDKKQVITGLRDKLVKLLSDYNLQMQLRQGCNKILQSDRVDLLARTVQYRKQAIKIDSTHRCASCASLVLSPANKSDSDSFYIFFCSHIYHQRCLQSTLTPANNPSNPSNNISNSQDIMKATPNNLIESNGTPISNTNLIPQNNQTNRRELHCQLCHNVKQRGAKRGGRFGNDRL
eukprot:TRINITY_DN188_c2_g2_i1.p1 TRINITY_DN188_c2_g2~~TRINITY_DN188_c2_g2_i1.p1  ORF type:complete len:925 (-),score=372.33 TRINITY_DN188_c2_g2_i1:105-2879(-)